MSPITLGFEVHYYLVLFSVLLHLGFNNTFTSWITTCLSSVTFEIMVNGGKSESFTPSKGLRQGDPLSFYLFILGQEVLSRLLDHEVRTKNISGIKASSRGSTITHVMYADDIILFSKATSKDAYNINAVLEKYCSWSRQRISNNKSGVFFSKHTHPSHCRHIKEILQLKILKKDGMYLGAPLILSKSSSLDFSYLCEKSWAGEVSAYLGQAGKSLSPPLHCLYLCMLCLLSTSPRRYVTK